MAQLVRAPASKAGDPFSNPGPRENFSLRLTTIRAVKRKKKTIICHITTNEQTSVHRVFETAASTNT